ncbi:MAG: AAA family ATPase [Bacteroidetes bacterium]|nr:AAA family ATPase [Bacteroidota bacterium]
MAKKKKQVEILRPHAEQLFEAELKALTATDKDPRPENWAMSPRSVVLYLMGGKAKDGTEITAKYVGQQRLMEIAVATLATDRALLLAGVPGTAKTWVSEHLAAAISGDSTLLVQGTAGISEEALRYGWNYAQLLSEGPSEKSLVASPVMRAMQEGQIARVEEMTRMPSDVQDSLITLLSEKVLPVPELNLEIAARKGFNVIATANTRDKGVHELSSALRRRFNTVVLPLPATLEEEVQIVRSRVKQLGESLSLPAKEAPLEEIRRLVKIFRELRSGQTEDGKVKLKSPGSTLSAAEAISVITSGQALASYFGKGEIDARDLASSLTGAIIQDPMRDLPIWQEYLETVVRDRKEWKDLYKACKEAL